MTFKERISNMLSRKFLIAVGGVLSGVASILQGEVVAGGALIGVSVIAYLISEGYVDAASAKTIISTASEVAETVSSATSNTTDDVISNIISETATQLNDE